MVGQSLWKNLKVLVVIDKQIEIEKENIQKTEKILNTELQAIPKLETEIEISKKNYLNEKKNVDLQELNAKDLKEKEAAKKKQLENITNPKEYKPVEKELKTLVSQVIEQDDILIKSWHQLEASKKKFETKKASNETQISQLKEGVEAQKETLKSILKTEKELSKQKEDAAKNIPADWLTKYERMRHKVADPIVPVLGESCSACYYSILRQDLQRLKKSEVLPCRSCYRFLYYDNQEEKEAEKETF